MMRSMFAVCGLAAFAAAVHAQVPYFNSFTAGNPGPEWSTQQTATSPSGQRFLGQFGSGGITLTLGPAAAGQYVVDFDFYAIQSLDGNGPAGGGQDNFEFTADNSISLFYTSFDNWGNGNTQAYPGQVGVGFFPTGSGAAATNSLGYTFGGAQYGDSTYHFSLTFTHAGGVLSFGANSQQNQPVSDESWGLDNVNVRAVPAPASSLALLGLAMASRRRRRS